MRQPIQLSAAFSVLALSAVAVLGGCASTATAPSPTSATSTATSPSEPTTAAPPPTSTPAPTTAARVQTWSALQPGDCVAEPPPTDPAVVTVTVVDCAGPHLAETFTRVGIPVDAALSENATAQCEAGFLTYTGRPSAGSGYTISYLIDSEQDRTSNNPLPSSVICLLQSAAGQALTGSARS
ncbi:MAG: hypothetical protein WCH82_14830 [Mycobacteriaceae bacterium]